MHDLILVYRWSG